MPSEAEGRGNGTVNATEWREADDIARAQKLIDSVELIDQSGMTPFAHAARYIAGELLWALEQLRASRSACSAMQEARDRGLAIILARAGTGDPEP